MAASFFFFFFLFLFNPKRTATAAAGAAAAAVAASLLSFNHRLRYLRLYYHFLFPFFNSLTHKVHPLFMVGILFLFSFLFAQDTQHQVTSHHVASQIVAIFYHRSLKRNIWFGQPPLAHYCTYFTVCGSRTPVVSARAIGFISMCTRLPNSNVS